MKVICTACNGEGEVQVSSFEDGEYFDKCPECKGAGYTEPEGLEELVELGRAVKYLFESPDMEEYVVLSIGKRTYDTLQEIVKEYKEWSGVDV